MQQETERGWRDPELERLFARLPHVNLLRVASSGTPHDAESMCQSLKSLALALV
jgi:hypothetical protein